MLRNALIPVVTLLGLSLPTLFSGAVFIEAIFAWPGVGRILVEGVQARDYPVVMAATAVSALLVVLGNLLADVLATLGRPARAMRDGRRLLDDPRARAGAAVLALGVAAAVLAPLLAGDPYLQRDIVATRFLSPLVTDSHGAFHLLGTDRFGRDVWARLLVGARVSLGVGALATIISVALGVAVGAVAGFWRGWLGAALLALTDFALALPRVVLLLLLASLWQPSAVLVILVLGFTGWMPIARLVYGEVRALAARPFVEGAIGLGAPGMRVLVRHILPNALTPVTVAAALGLGNAILLEAGLSFSGARRAATGALLGKPDRVGT